MTEHQTLELLAGFEIDIAQIGRDLEVAREYGDTLRVFELNEELADYLSERAKYQAKIARPSLFRFFR